MKTYYEVLGVKADSTASDIYSAFVNEAVQFHPDIVNLMITSEYQKERFQSICLAYACLSDAYLRQKYDDLTPSLQRENAARKSLFLKGSERNVTENEACLIWETACIGQGSIPNKVLREHSLKMAEKSPQKVATPQDDDDVTEEFEDVTNTPIKPSPSEAALKADVTEPKSAKPELTIKDLITSVKFGLRSEITRHLYHYPDMVNDFDEQGYTAVHWAAKSGNVSILQTLFINGAKMNLMSKSQDPMAPIHWAASDGKIGTIRYLLDNNVSINVQDSKGCTPVVIAAQHDQHTCVTFLAKNGADMSLGDDNRDTALHWAAYKGYAQLIGLLTYLCPGGLNVPDAYGQTPLHLAALRGNVDALEYLVLDCHADTTIKDKNGHTPLELAVKKNQFRTEWALRVMSTASKWDLAKYLYETSRLFSSHYLKNLVLGSNNREMAVWPWRVVFASNFIGSCYSLYFTFHEQMADCWLLHMINTALQTSWWFCFWMCLQTNLSDVVDPLLKTTIEDGKSVSMYENALRDVGLKMTESPDGLPNFCHTCRVIRPLRSKHCQIQRRCINKFDHFCPFVFNTVSRDNYKYFLGVIGLHVVLSVVWIITALTLNHREGISWSLTAFTLYLCLWILALGGLVSYHAKLVQKNMTTNEEMNVNIGKYPHFKDENNRFDNPFDLGNPLKNLIDAIFPSPIQLYSREEAKVFQRQCLSGSEGSDRESLLHSNTRAA
jgi:curved DNA-binding protein CbpA